MPLDDRTQATAAGFEGLIPPSRPPNPSRSWSRTKCPHGVVPSEAFLPAAVELASQLLPSRAFASQQAAASKLTSTPRSARHLRVLPNDGLGFASGHQDWRLDPHRPLWDFPPRRFPRRLLVRTRKPARSTARDPSSPPALHTLRRTRFVRTIPKG